MKIVRVTPHLLEKRLNRSMHISRGGFAIRRHALVEVETDAGIVGLGEGIGDAARIHTLLRNHLGPQAVGGDPFNLHGIGRRLLGDDVYFERMGSTLAAASAIEMACWDIKGKALGLPVHDLLGGKRHERLAAYASDVYWEREPERMAAEALRIREAGFGTIKMHIGVESPREECRRIEAIRHAVGDGVRLMIDLNAGYHLLDALEAERLWRPFDPYWIEEPLRPGELDGLATLHRRSATPIACGENLFGADDFKRLLDHGAADALMPDVGRVGGLAEGARIATLAAAYGVPVSPHNFSSGVLLAATIQLLATLENGGPLELDTSGNAVYEELLAAPLALERGCVVVPDLPGLGVTLPAEILERHKIG